MNDRHARTRSLLKIAVVEAALSFAAVGTCLASAVEWEFPRTANCHEGLPFSDGVTGVLVWGGNGTVNLTVGRADLWDHRGGYPWLPAQNYTNIAALAARHDKPALARLFPNPAKPGEPRNPYMLPLGRVTLKYPSDWKLRTGSLDTETGLGELVFERRDSASGKSCETNRVGLAMPKARHAFVLSLPKDFAFDAACVPATDREPFFANSLGKFGFQKAVKRPDGFDWRIPADRSVSLDFVRGERMFALSTRRGNTLPVASSVAKVPFDEIRRESIAQWAAFWKEGARIRVPDPVLQRLYDYGMYRFGAMTDPDGVPAGLQGPWLEDDRLVPWNGDYHFNINVQECYAPAYRGGHFKNLMPLFRMVLSWRPRLRENAKTFVGIDDGYCLPHSVDDRGVCIGGFWSGTIDHGSTAWMASLMYRYVKYAGDAEFLRRDAYDFMKGAMNVYLAMAEERDGRLSLPLCASPEWFWVGRDSSFQLAAAHRLAKDLVGAAAKLGEKPDPRWLDLIGRLPLYNRRPKGGIDIYDGQSLTESHRHHSHLAGLYPFDTLDLSNAEIRADAVSAMNLWTQMGNGSWSGWCVPWASILHTHFGQTRAAVAKLHDWDAFFSGPGHASHHDAVCQGYTVFTGRPEVMQMDGQCAAAAAILELLAHEVNGKVEFFKGCPEEWKDVSFKNLALSDGTRVDGSRKNGTVTIRQASSILAVEGTDLAGVSVAIDATQPGAVLPNTSQVLTFWNGVMKGDRSLIAWPKELRRDYSIGFVRYAELMACTGGNKSRDLFKNPNDRTVLDDYDFGPLVAACRGILGCGMKPYLKLGNVPAKFSSDYDGGEFLMNIRPPTDDLVHYRYMKACAAALKAAFGLDEVRSWRFAVLTEADNTGWFQVKSKLKAETREAFFRLYDYAARAFEEELGPNLVFGTHLLYPIDPNNPQTQFSVEEVVAHCATGTNAATGKIGAPLRLLTASYYGWSPNRDDLAQGRCTNLRRIRAALDKAGLTDVVTGVDEGRIIIATPGREKRDLVTRAVGASYQAAFDVRMMKEIFDDRMDYVATWGYFSGPNSHFEGVPSHHYFSSREFAKFEGSRRVTTRVSGKLPPKEEMDAIAAVSQDGRIVRAVVGRFRDQLVLTNRLETTVTFRLPKDWADKRVRVSVLTLDDRNNWFVDWERDRVAHGITAKDFDWSWDDFAVLAGKGLRNKRLRAMFANEFQPRYAKKAASVRPTEEALTVSAAATLTLPISFVGNGAAFLSVEPR